MNGRPYDGLEVFQNKMNPSALFGNSSGVAGLSTKIPETEERLGLFERAREGDAEAFCHLIQPLEERLYRQAWLFCRDRALAEDLSQDTLVATWKGFSRFDGRCELFTWLYAILLRVWKKRLRASSRRPLSFFGLAGDREREAAVLESIDPEVDPAKDAEFNELQKQLDLWIERLPDKMKETLRIAPWSSPSRNSRICLLVNSSISVTDPPFDSMCATGPGHNLASTSLCLREHR